MNEKEVLTILQYYRHDIANELQVVQGYLSMGNIDVANAKMNALFQYFQEERKLLQLGVPKFSLWIIRFNSVYDHAHLTYNIHMEGQRLSEIDQLLLTRCKQIIESICDPDGNYYKIHLTLKPSINDSEKVLVEMLITGDLKNIKNNKLEFDVNIQMKRTEEVLFNFIV